MSVLKLTELENKLIVALKENKETNKSTIQLILDIIPNSTGLLLQIHRESPGILNDGLEYNQENMMKAITHYLIDFSKTLSYPKIRSTIKIEMPFIYVIHSETQEIVEIIYSRKRLEFIKANYDWTIYDRTTYRKNLLLNGFEFEEV